MSKKNTMSYYWVGLVKGEDWTWADGTSLNYSRQISPGNSEYAIAFPSFTTYRFMLAK